MTVSVQPEPVPADGPIFVVLAGLLGVGADRRSFADLGPAGRSAGGTVLPPRVSCAPAGPRRSTARTKELPVIMVTARTDEVDFVVGTFSKSVGTVGGFCVSNHPKFDIMRLVCRPYVFTASLPPSVVATAATSIRKLMHAGNKRAHLWENSRTLHAGLQARHGVQQRQRSDLAAREHEVAQADLHIHLGVDEALVYALVTPAQQNGAAADGPLRHRAMVQALANGRKQHQRHPCRDRLGTIGTDGGQAACQRLGHHHHAGATAKGAVVHAAVVALGMVARVPQAYIDLARSERAARHAAGHERSEQLGKQGDDVEAHKRDCGGPSQ